MCSITGKLTNGVSAICFSNNGNLIAATDMNEEHSLVIYDVK